MYSLQYQRFSRGVCCSETVVNLKCLILLWQGFKALHWKRPHSESSDNMECFRKMHVCFHATYIAVMYCAIA